MATGMVLTVAQTLFAALQSTELRELCSVLGYKSQLDALQRTVTTIKAVLLDAESKHQELTYEGRDWIEKLKDAVYDADDLFDEFTTIAQQLKRTPGGKISKKVRRFFSGENQLLFAANTSRKVKKLREKLDVIAKDRTQFGFIDVYKPVKRRDETCSYVYEESIIGREAEREGIVGMLLSDSSSYSYVSTKENVSYVTIVGIGGLGKTALAQLVFNDIRIKEAFKDCMNWVCVSEEFGMKEILGKMLGKNEHKLEELLREARKHIEGKRYLLVLDDVWSESREKWVELRDFLSLGGRGSRVLVTSRSMEVANVVGDDLIYELQGLSEEKSWDLFKRIALEKGKELEDDLIDIGKDITKKCANVPLSIRVIGSLLYGQDKTKWLAFRSFNLAEMRLGKDGIMPTLMFSYYHLTPELKSCFSFCSLFPKDYDIDKELLINLWLAQGYLIPSHKGQSLEDVGEDYFSILLQRCFFQDIKQNEFGKVHSCKMHDLIHDLAQEVAGKESLILTSSTNHIGGKVRHLSTDYDICLNNWFSPSYNSSTDVSRTFFRLYEPWDRYQSNKDVPTIITHYRRLRVLHLQYSVNETLPYTLGKLLHLRYLDLSYNKKLEILPKSITQLHNLQILRLCRCENLKGLAEDMSKLVNLRMLNIEKCDKLTHMPIGMYNLTCLHTLTMFVVGGNDPVQVKKGELRDLKALVNLKGDLRIKVRKFSSNIMSNDSEPSYILRSAHLKSLEIMCEVQHDELCEIIGPFDQGHIHETLLEGLYPNHDLSRIVMSGYQGTKLPTWASLIETSLPRLVTIELSDIVGLQHLTSLSQLCHLKCLILSNMPNMEYIESDAPSTVGTTFFFLSLEKLELKHIPKLKGWWRDLTWMEMEAGNGCLVNSNNGMKQVAVVPSFPGLRILRIMGCKSMTYFPASPNLKQLTLFSINDALTFCMKGRVLPSSIMHSDTATSSLSSSNLSVSVPYEKDHPNASYLEELSIDNLEVFNSLFQEFVLGAVRVKISDLEAITIGREGFRRCASSLQHLTIVSIRNLKNLAGGGLEQLTNLQYLVIDWCLNLDFEEGSKDDEGMPWKSLQTLTSLQLSFLPKLVSLPMGLQYLTSLQSLRIEHCYSLEDVGECISYLTSLQSLQIVGCMSLKALPKCFHSLTSLKSLHISNSGELKSLPEAMRHLTSLTTLEVLYACSDLVERCREPDGEDWPNIRHIPHLRISLIL